jgi:hypothetical protein
MEDMVSAFRIGFNEPNALAIIGNDGSGDNHIFHLYVREKDPKAASAFGSLNPIRNADLAGVLRSITSLTSELTR